MSGTISITLAQLLDQLAENEQLALVSSDDPKVKLFLYRVAGSGSWIDLSDAIIKNGMDYLVSVNIISAARASMVLSNLAAAA